MFLFLFQYLFFASFFISVEPTNEDTVLKIVCVTRYSQYYICGTDVYNFLVLSLRRQSELLFQPCLHLAAWVGYGHGGCTIIDHANKDHTVGLREQRDRGSQSLWTFSWSRALSRDRETFLSSYFRSPLYIIKLYLK